MPEIASSEWEIILYYNPNSLIARSTIAYAKGAGLAVREVDILKTIFTGVQLEEIAERLNTNVEGLVNKNHAKYLELFKTASFDEEDWIKILRKNPDLIKEPIAIKGHQTLVVETPSEVSRL